MILAEMGDKTQLLAMAFAMKYKAYQVLLAVFIATLLNHSLAVLAGHFLTVVIPIRVISFIAALSFVAFGLWTLRGDKLAGEENRKTSFGPVATVAIAFFIAEMGDKTQLATISLAVEYRNMLHVLFGTTLAMVTADAIGIIAGVVMHKHIPENAVRWASAVIFILFGLSGIYDVMSIQAGSLYVWPTLGVITAATFYLAWRIVRHGKNYIRPGV